MPQPSPPRPTGTPPPVALAGLLGIAAVLVALLLLVAGRYGYHRDELDMNLSGWRGRR